MKFFIPGLKECDWENIYDAILKFNSAPEQGRRIYSLEYEHNSKKMACKVGGQLDNYYSIHEEVVAILDCGFVFKICTKNRGFLRGEAILAGKNEATPTYFD